jgi:hypothetical protein
MSTALNDYVTCKAAAEELSMKPRELWSMLKRWDVPVVLRPGKVSEVSLVRRDELRAAIDKARTGLGRGPRAKPEAAPKKRGRGKAVVDAKPIDHELDGYHQSRRRRDV